MNICFKYGIISIVDSLKGGRYINFIKGCRMYAEQIKEALLVIKGVVAALGGVIIYWLGGLDELLTALIVVIVLDYITGVLGAVHSRALSSEVGFRGIVKKVLCLVIVALSFVVEQLVAGSLPLREIVIMFFVANEGLSILENAGKMGLKLPDKLMEALVKLGGHSMDEKSEK